MLYCGVSQRCITPKTPVYLAGYAARWGHLSTGVHDDLFVKAFYFRNKNQSLVMLFVDAEGVPEQVIAPVRKRITATLGIAHVCVCATHTHSAPHTYEQAQLDHAELCHEWIAHLQDSLFAAAREAAGREFEAMVGYDCITVPEIARNRRPGHNETDPELCVLKVTDLKSRVRGLLLTYGCHCTVLDASSCLVSADYPGFIYQIMGVRFPHAVTAFSNGVAGDINIGYSSDASALGESMNIRTFENAQHIAQLLCKRALECESRMALSPNLALGVTVKQVAYPLRSDLPAAHELRRKINAIDKKVRTAASDCDIRALKIEKIYLQCLLLRLKSNVLESGVLYADSLFIQLGKLLYITIPGELFTETGRQIKARFNKHFKTVILGYSNGYIGYIPSTDAMNEGGYESETSIFAEDVADALVHQLEAVELNACHE